MLRGFTVRWSAAGTLAFDVMDRSDARWADRLRPGRLVGVAGMRFGYAGTGRSGHHLLVGDRSALPAIAASLAGVPGTASSTVIIAAAEASDRTVLGDTGGVGVHWVGDLGAAAAMVADTVHAPLAHVLAVGEVRLVADVHRLAVGPLGVPMAHVQPIVYWQRGLSADERDPLVFARYQAAAAAGRDVGDPALVADLELEPVGE